MNKFYFLSCAFVGMLVALYGFVNGVYGIIFYDDIFGSIFLILIGITALAMAVGCYVLSNKYGRDNYL
jgi:hypothetical protein